MKKTWKAVALGLTLSLCVASFGACSKKDETTKEETTTSATEETATESESESESEEESATEATSEGTVAESYEEGYPVELTDIYGNKAVITSKPKKVVSVSPACTELIYSLGVEDTLVGRTNYCNYPEAVQSIETIGDINAPDIEKIISLEPDLVIADSIFPEDAYNQLTGLGINVVILNQETVVDGVYNKIENMGKIFHVEDKANEVIAEMKAKIDGVQEALKDVKNHPSVYYVVSFGEGGDWTATGDTFINDIIELAGAENAAKIGTGWAYNVEDLISQDPAIIIIPSWADGTFQTTAPYSELTAVKEGNVIVLESTDMFDRQCARNADAVEMLAKLIFPECFEATEEKAA